MDYKPISDYGVIGDMHSAALAGADGSIDWLCFPRFDCPSVFGALLDSREGGRFRISPSDPQARSTQAYLPDSNVLATEFRAGSGIVTLTDFMPVGGKLADSPHEVVRIARCASGEVEMQLAFEPRLDYGRGRTRLTFDGALATARSGEDALSLISGVPLEGNEVAATASFRLRQGESASFVLRWGGEPAPERRRYNVAAELEQTQAFWRFVSSDYHYDGRWQEAVKRSMMALHLLIYAPTGAVCAAATTSLPERIGGGRNWDYRFCWLRDAAFTMDIFHRMGHTAYTRPFLEWLAHLRLCDEREDTHSLYGIGLESGHAAMKEITLDRLEGYRGSRPVRAGNAAYHQFQLDVYGEILLAFDSYQRAGGDLEGPLWDLAQCLVEGALRNWERPDHGIWEFRTEPRHFTYSKLMAWVAVDRGLRLARALRKPVDFDRWRGTRALIRQDIIDRGWDQRRGSFLQHYEGSNLDASLLFIPMVGFLGPDDPRLHGTIDAVRADLGVDGMLYRYHPEEADDGLPGREGTFTMCSLWLAGALLATGRLEEARETFERVLGFSNSTGLFSEMLEPETGGYLGNYPQAFTHIALIHTARNLDRALNAAEQGKTVSA
ncbi:MAG TPA: glycoside hydrolase family 15 protein [Dehalococcoidia bacterium]|nr:glycoside hydrolase family 15 protein [Dehalococcoidia bacterium]